MKKLLITLLLLITCFANSYAYDACIDGIYYNLVKKNAFVTSGDNKYSGSVNIPETVAYDGKDYTVTSIENKAFYGCSGLKSATIPNSVTSIGEYAFYDCTGLKSVTIGNSVTSIGYGAFDYCKSLTSVVIPESVTSIGSYAFSGCTGLTSINIPNSIISIGSYTFYKCTGLTSVEIQDLSAWCKIQFSYEFSNPLSYANKLYLNGEEIKDLIIPNSVTSIGDCAFWCCSGLTSVTMPNSVTSIGSSAFSGCTGLTSVTMPNSVTSIGSSAFSGCTGLTSVTIPNCVASIGDGTFYYCTGLTSVIIPNSVTSIGEWAFDSCKNLEDIYCYAERVPNMGAEVFNDAYVEYAKLHVPEASVDRYKNAGQWKDFGTIVGISETEPTISQCAAPEIAYESGKFCFLCETDGAEFHYTYTIKQNSISGEGTGDFNTSDIKLNPTITITAYATAEGYKQSETVTKTFDMTSGGSEDINGDGNVDSQDVLKIYDYMKNH